MSGDHISEEAVEAAREAIKLVVGGAAGGVATAGVFNSYEGGRGAIMAGGTVLVVIIVVFLLLYGLNRASEGDDNSD